MTVYDVELLLAVERQRGVELRTEVERHRLAREVRDGGPARRRWWRRIRADRGGTVAARPRRSPG
jgi:hypothetical protein